MLAPHTTYARLHRELTTHRGRLDTIDRGRLTRIFDRPGGLTYRDAAWIQRKHKEIYMSRKIDEESERLLLEAHTELLNCITREEAAAMGHKDAKNATASAQYRLNRLLAEAKDPNLFKTESNT